MTDLTLEKYNPKSQGMEWEVQKRWSKTVRKPEGTHEIIRNMNREEEYRLISRRQSRIAELLARSYGKNRSLEYPPFVFRR